MGRLSSQAQPGLQNSKSLQGMQVSCEDWSGR